MFAVVKFQGNELNGFVIGTSLQDLRDRCGRRGLRELAMAIGHGVDMNVQPRSGAYALGAGYLLLVQEQESS